MKWQISVGTGYSLGPFRRDMATRLARAAGRASDKAAMGARDDIRRDMRGKRLGNLANVVSFTSDQKKGRIPQGGDSFDVAGFVTVRGIRSARTAGALKAYVDQDTTNIAPVRAKWLAIPTNEIPRRAGRKRMTPALYKSTGLEGRIGELTFIPGKHSGVAYLVVTDATILRSKGGKAKRPRGRGLGGASRARVGFVAFVLIRQTRRQRRVDPRAIARYWQGQLPKMLAAEFDRGGNSQRFTPQVSTSFRL